MSESMREEFEVWLNADAGRQIASGKVIDLWREAWQASRAALCVELPDSHCEAQDSYMLSCEKAIHAAGVKTN